MIAIRRILCPTDLSSVSPQALHLALALARQQRAAVVVLHVASPSTESSAGSRLASVVDPLRGMEFPVEAMMLRGEVVEGILAHADAMGADVIVMGTRAQRPGHGWHLGSVTERVLRRAACPVLIVARPVARKARGPFRRILCPSDFSGVSERAIEYGLGLARSSRARLILLHVLEWFPGQGERAHVYVPEYQLDLSEVARERLRLAISFEDRDTCEHEELVAIGQPHREILRVARERKADLIVLGVHGRRALDRSLLGATVSHVVRETRCPVLAVPMDQGARRAEAEDPDCVWRPEPAVTGPW